MSDFEITEYELRQLLTDIGRGVLIPEQLNFIQAMALFAYVHFRSGYELEDQIGHNSTPFKMGFTLLPVDPGAPEGTLYQPVYFVKRRGVLDGKRGTTALIFEGLVPLGYQTVYRALTNYGGVVGNIVVIGLRGFRSYNEASFRKRFADYLDGIKHPFVHFVDSAQFKQWLIDFLVSEQQCVNNFLTKINSLNLQDFGQILLPKMSRLAMQQAISELHLPSAHQNRIVRVDYLPFRVIQSILDDPRHVHELTPRQFEEFVAQILYGLKFQDIIVTPHSGDGGKDIVASKVINNIPITFFFECKKYAEGHKVQLNETATR